jgi:hypothetical protein
VASSYWHKPDITMPVVVRPLRPLIAARFDQENVRTLAALRQYAEAPGGQPGLTGAGRD